MKRTTLLVAILILLLAFSAQAKEVKKNIHQGDFLIGGATDVGFGGGKDTEAQPDGADDLEISNINFNLNTWFGYFVTDGFELGPVFGVDYSRQTAKDQSVQADDAGNETVEDIITTNSLFDVGIQMAYFFDTETVAAPYLQLGLSYVGGNTTVDNGFFEAKMDVSGYQIAPKGGVDIFFTPAIAMDFGLFMAYTGGKRERDEDAATSQSVKNDFNTLDYGLAVGFNFFF